MDRPLTMSGKIVRVGCGSGFWGDSAEGPAQLVRSGGIDYLVLDYLAEVTIALLARARSKRPELGYATDFVEAVMAPLCGELASRRIKVVTNAGGINPAACRTALVRLLREKELDLSIAVVSGDDLSGSVERLRGLGVREMTSGAPLPADLWSVNAYLGAFPIAAALDAGADIVITGRCVDSALALGPLIHEFGWGAGELDRLAGGSLAGHVIECGAQATGGLFTDWREVPGWDRMGFPIVECAEDGTFVLTKPQGTGGLVTPATLAEQIVYEVGDPAAYHLPDVTCDLSHIRLEQDGPDRVGVSGARGSAPNGRYKVCATHADGWRASVVMMIAGSEAAEKARRVADAILARARRLMQEAGHADFAETSVEILGAETYYGTQSRAGGSREVVLKIAASHSSPVALDLFSREIYPAATAMAQGLTGLTGGRPKPQPLLRLFSFLVDKGEVPVAVGIGDRTITVEAAAKPAPPRAQPASPPASAEAEWRPAPPLAQVPLLALAHGRSGDKGDIANIGLLARDPLFLPPIRTAVTPDAVRQYFAHLVRGHVERFDWPGIDGFNFVLHGALGGGGTASLRHDPQGKTYAQILLDMPVPVPAAWLEPGGVLAGKAVVGERHAA